MILPIELIIYVDQYSTNHNFSQLSKLINKEINQSNSEYWKLKYIEKTVELGIDKIALDANQKNFNGRYEYSRLIKNMEALKRIYIVTPPYGGFHYTGEFLKYFEGNITDSDYSIWRIHFHFPYCTFDKNKFKKLEEFKKFSSFEPNFNELEHNSFYCLQCAGEQHKLDQEYKNQSK